VSPGSLLPCPLCLVHGAWADLCSRGGHAFRHSRHALMQEGILWSILESEMEAILMKIVDFITESHVIADLEAREKGEVLLELSRHLADVSGLDADVVHRILEEREKLGSTGIDEGVAIPHGKLSSLKHLEGLVARSIKGVDFDAIDGKPTHLFVVLLTPDNNAGLLALARVSRMMRAPSFRETLLKAADSAEMYRIIAEQDSRI